MNKRNRNNYYFTAILFIAFIILTSMIKSIDVKPEGPEGSSIGFATVNLFVFNLFGVNLFWYQLTDWLGIAAILSTYAFAVLGLYQLIRRRCLKNVDADIILLGLFYIAVISCYVIFERVIINYRPVLMDGELEASYPSSHIMIVVSLISASMIQLHKRIKKRALLRITDIISILIISVTVIGRFVSGVHWFTDITGGLLLSAALTVRLMFLHILPRPCSAEIPRPAPEMFRWHLPVRLFHREQGLRVSLPLQGPRRAIPKRKQAPLP